MWQKSYDNSPTLFLVATPIGNLDDITFRAINTLKEVDVIFCEDTRVTGQLLNHFSIKNKLISLHNFNEENVKEKVLNYLQEGKNVAIVTDRGTPIISDPGYKTVKYVKDNGYNVVSIPGACAMISAITVSGLSSEHFLFYGFLDSKESHQLEELNALESYDYSIVFYEAPHRLVKTLNNIYKVFGNRNISISKEISKLHEMVFTGTLEEAINDIKEPKGEYVLVVAPSEKTVDNDMDIIENVDLYINSGLSVMDAIKKVARERKLAKNIIYKEYIERRK